MSMHPATEAVAQAVPQAQLATIEMASQPGGVRTVLLCPLNQPDNIVVVLAGSARAVMPEPTDENPVLTAFGPTSMTMAPGTYGLAPCTCCDGDRWRVVLPIVQFDGWQDYQLAFAQALGQHFGAHLDLYCLRDVQAIAQMTRR